MSALVSGLIGMNTAPAAKRGEDARRQLDAVVQEQRDAVAARHPAALQLGRELRGPLGQLRVGIGAVGADQRDLVWRSRHRMRQELM